MDINELNKILQEADEFSSMEKAFGIKKDEDMTDEEKGQFGDMKTVNDIEIKPNIKTEVPIGLKTVNSVKDKSKKETDDYHSDLAKKIKNFQNIPDEKLDLQHNRAPITDEQKDEFDSVRGGMTGVKYETEPSDSFKERNQKNMGKKFTDIAKKQAKADSEKVMYNKEPQPVSNNKSEPSKSYKFYGVKENNYYKTNGKILSETHVLNLSEKVSDHLKNNEEEFVIHDGTSFYKLKFNELEVKITGFYNENYVSSVVDDMKRLWGYDANNYENSKKNVSENNFKKFYDLSKKKI
jgi:hypothetical protein